MLIYPFNAFLLDCVLFLGMKHMTCEIPTFSYLQEQFHLLMVIIKKKLLVKQTISLFV